MPAQVGRAFRNDDHMPRPRRDLLLATRADVDLHGLEGMDDPDLDRLVLFVGPVVAAGGAAVAMAAAGAAVAAIAAGAAIGVHSADCGRCCPSAGVPS